MQWPFEWNPELRQALGESLSFYFLNVNPLNPSQAFDELAGLVADEGLGGVYAFPVFGKVDLVVAAWMPEGYSVGRTGSLREVLARYLTNLRGVAWTVPVESVDVSHSGTGRPIEVTLELDSVGLDDVVGAQKTGSELHNTQQRLLESSVLLRRRSVAHGEVEFVVDVVVPHPEGGATASLSRSIRAHAHQSDALADVEVYRTTDRLVVMAKAKSYFDIAPMLAWLGGQLEPFPAACTQTFLVGMPGGRWPYIGQRTLDSMRS